MLNFEIREAIIDRNSGRIKIHNLTVVFEFLVHEVILYVKVLVKTLKKATTLFRKQASKFVDTAFSGGRCSEPISQHFRLVTKTEGLERAAIVVNVDRDDILIIEQWFLPSCLKFNYCFFGLRDDLLE